MISTIHDDLRYAGRMLAAGDLHRAEQWARAAHADAVEASFDPTMRADAIALMDQAQAIIGEVTA